MAEYNMTYEEVRDFVDECIALSSQSEEVKLHRPEILAAITARNENDHEMKTSIKESLELWKNQIGTPSELLLGTRYIAIKDSVIVFIREAFTSGFIDTIISAKTIPGNPEEHITLGVVSGIICALIDVFKSVAKLEDYDFCIYLQAVTHYRAHKEFTIDDLKEWFPHTGHLECNMHTSKWDCEHWKDDDSCDMLQGDKLEKILYSLYNDKKLLNRKWEHENYVYSFKV